MYGRLAQHEDPITGLKREVEEELSIAVTPLQPLTTWRIYRGHEETAENELIGITYYATTGDAQVTISDEHSEYRWVTAEDALSLIKIGGIKRDINAYLDLQGPTL